MNQISQFEFMPQALFFLFQAPLYPVVFMRVYFNYPLAPSDFQLLFHHHYFLNLLALILF